MIKKLRTKAFSPEFFNHCDLEKQDWKIRQVLLLPFTYNLQGEKL